LTHYIPWFKEKYNFEIKNETNKTNKTNETYINKSISSTTHAVGNTVENMDSYANNNKEVKPDLEFIKYIFIN
jgi:hypothetical protein